MNHRTRVWGVRAAMAAPATLIIACVVWAGPVNTGLNDFFGPGTQPNMLTDPIVDSQVCGGCHGDFDAVTEPYRPWAASMMGQAARDPIFFACLAIAEQDAPFVGDLCLRCHTPGGWLEGRSVPTDGSALTLKDEQGVNCQVCHRLVDPVPQPITDPNDARQPADAAILAALSDLPVNPHSAQFVVDPQDRRRGPYDLGSLPFHEWLESPFHRSAALCATCHDVSNPAFTRDPNSGSYVLNDPNTPHPTHNKYDEFPVERTYSEWLMSDFALGPIDMGGRFGGNEPLVSTCQDCHMPEVGGQGCFVGDSHTDLKAHYFNGGNTWVLRAIQNLYPDSETQLQEAQVTASIARAEAMLQDASDMELTLDGNTINVRVINQSGHKLPTGYPEGRRMWLNVQYYDHSGDLVLERGAYDPNSAVLTTADTVVYEGKLGVDAAVSAATGIPLGESFHFAVNNEWIKDNRIPPRGFSNANFAAVQAAPVGATYADGQYWADAGFAVVPGAVRADVRLYFQTTSKEYIEFLRDENTTNTAGQIAYDQWALTGKSAPVEMDFETLAFPCYGDTDGNNLVNITDLGAVLSNFGATSGASRVDGDVDGDGDIDITDLGIVLSSFGSSCV